MAQKPATAMRRAGRSRTVKVEPAAATVSEAADGAPSSYQQALKYLAELTDFERLRQQRLQPEMFKLERMRLLLEKLGNPQDTVKLVHIAGTKGKGSTCEMTAAALEGCGYTVGLYTSPHLIDVRERIRINRRMVSHADFAALLDRTAAAAKPLESKHGQCTYFEHMTAMALLHFSQQAVDVGVIEVGLGGRLDSTNTIRPEVCAITTIGLDHTHLLGDTAEKIAREKAGIFKQGVPAITVPQKPGVLAVLKEVAAQVGAPLRVLGEDIDFAFRFDPASPTGPGARVSLSTPRCSYEHLRVPLKGEHQALNCGLALAIIDALAERGFKCPESKAVNGLETTDLAGRMELTGRSPRLLLDGAHNEDSVRALMRAVPAHIPFDSLVVVFGCCADKDIPSMLRELSMGADKVIFTRSAGTPRAADPRDLARKYNEIAGKMSQFARDLPEALAMAAKCAARDDLICVTGSMYLVGEAKRHLGSTARPAPARR